MDNKLIASKGLEIFAKIWGFGVFLLVLAGLIGIWMSDGFSRVQEIFSPFNVINWIVIIVFLSPSIGAFYLAEKLKTKPKKTSSYPKIDRSNFTPNHTKDPESDEIDIGWDEGLLRDGRLYRLEYWAVSGISMLTYFISTKEIENYSNEELKDLLVKNDLIEFIDPERGIEAQKIIDPNNNEFWSLNIAIGDEDNLYARDKSNIKKYDR